MSLNLPPPTYHLTEADQRFKVSVAVCGVEYSGEKDFESTDRARENAMLIALASIGLAALSREIEGILN